MRKQDIYIALDWLKPALDETCNRISQLLSVAASSDNKNLLNDVHPLIHQITGTLQLTELNDFLILAETLEEYTHFVHDNFSKQHIHDLLQAVTVLQFEINAFHKTKKKHSSLLYQRANYLRSLMSKPRLGTESDETLNLDDILSADKISNQPIDTSERNTLHASWQQSTLALLDKKPTATHQLLQVSSLLKKAESSHHGAVMWTVAHEWIASLALNEQLETEHYIQSLNELNENIITIASNEKVEALIVDMLIQLIGFDHVTESASSLIQKLNPQLNQNQSNRVLDSVTVILNSAVSTFEANPRSAKNKLQEASWLLEVGGWHIYQHFIFQIVQDIDNINQHSAQKEESWRIQRQLAELQQAITKTLQLLGTHKTATEGMIKDAKVAVLREARIDLEEVKTLFNGYCLSKKLDDLAYIPPALIQVKGAFNILSLDKAAGLIAQLNDLFTTILASTQLEILSWDEVDALADVLSGFEYYLDILAQQFHDDSILEKIAANLLKAARLLEKNLSTPISRQSISNRNKSLKNVTHYDDNGTVYNENDDGAGDTDHPSSMNNPVITNDIIMNTDTTGVSPIEQNNMDDILTQTAKLPDTQEVRKARLVLGEDNFSFDDEIREIFIEEAEEVFEHINRYLPIWEADLHSMEPITEIRRGFHTLKGSGRMVGAHQASQVAWSIENLLNRILDKTLHMQPAILAHVKETTESMSQLVTDFSNRQKPSHNPIVLIARSHNLMADKPINAGLLPEGDLASSTHNDHKESTRVVSQDALNSERIDTTQAGDASTSHPSIASAQTTDALLGKGVTMQTPVGLVSENQDFDFDDLGDFDFSLEGNEENQDTQLQSSEEAQSATHTQTTSIDTPTDEITSEESVPVTSNETDSVEQAVSDHPSEVAPVTNSATEQSEEEQPAHAENEAQQALNHWIETIVPPIADDLTCSDDIKEIFVEEAQEVLEHIDTKLPEWRNDLDSRTSLADIRRGFHTLKGSGRMVGANRVGELAWHVEDMLNRIVDGAIAPTQELTDIVDCATGLIPNMVTNFETGQNDETNILPLMAVAKSHAQKQGLHPALAISIAQGHTLDQAAPAVATESTADTDTAKDVTTETIAASAIEETTTVPLDNTLVAAQPDVDQPDASLHEMTQDSTSSEQPVVENTTLDTDDTFDFDGFDLDDADADAANETAPITEAVQQEADDASIDTDIDADFDDLSFELDDDAEVSSDSQTQTISSNTTVIDNDSIDDFDFDLPEDNDDSTTVAAEPEATVQQDTHDDVLSPATDTQGFQSAPVVEDDDEFDINLDDTGIFSSLAIDETQPAATESDVTSNSDVKEVFIEEAENLLLEIQEFVDEHPDGGEVTDDIIRALHTMRGSAAMSGITVLQQLNMNMEMAYRHLMDNRIDLSPHHVSLLQEVCNKSRQHIETYKAGDIVEPNQSDIDLISTISDLTAIDENTLSGQSKKVHVSALVELNIDDLLDAEWELKDRLLSDEKHNYISLLRDQIDRLQPYVSTIPNLSEVLERLYRLYGFIQKDTDLAHEASVINGLMQAHQNITTMFDAMAASQRVQSEPHLIQTLTELESWILASTDDDTDSEIDDEFQSLADLDAFFSMEDTKTMEAVSVDEDNTDFNSIADLEADISASTPAIETTEATDDNMLTGSNDSAVVDAAPEVITQDVESLDNQEDDALDNEEIDNLVDEFSESFDDISADLLEEVPSEPADVATPVVNDDAIPEDTNASTESPVETQVLVDTSETEATPPTEQPSVEDADFEQTDLLSRPIDTTQSRVYETNIETDLLSIFLEESEELALDIDNNLNQWQSNPSDTVALAELQRHLHTMKGGARMVGITSVGDLTHEAENVYELLVAGKLTGTPSIVRFMRHIQDVVAQQVDELVTNERSFFANEELNTLRNFVTTQDESVVKSFFEDFTQEMPALTDDMLADDATTSAADTDAHANPVTQTGDTSQDQATPSAEQVAVHEQATPTNPNSVDLTVVPYAVNTRVESLVWDADDQPDPEMLEIFLEEAAEIVDSSSSLLHEWITDITAKDKLQALQRALHTLKGGARMAGVDSLGDLSHEMEFIYEDLAIDKKPARPEIIKVLSQSHDWLAEAVQVLTDGNNPGYPDSLIAPLKSIMADAEQFNIADFASASSVSNAIVSPDMEFENTAPTADASTTSNDDTPAVAATEDHAATGDSVASATHLEPQPNQPPPVPADEAETKATPAKQAPAQPATSVFNEIQEGKSLNELLKAQDPSKSTKTFNLPDMKGNFDADDSQQGNNEMIRISSSLMETMINLSGEAAINRGRVEVSNTSLTQTIEEMGATVQRLADQLRRMDIELEAQILAQYEGEIAQYEDFDPLEMDQYSSLNQLSKSLSESASDLLDIKSTMLEKTRETEALLLQQSRIQTELQEGLMNSRLVPFSRLNSRLQRIIRQTANELGKSAELTILNADSEVDRTILDRITSPLEHMLRNAVDHGIEIPTLRSSAGKGRAGKITLSVKREGGEIVITVTDDGKGIDVNAVRKKATERGLITNQELSDVDIMQYIFHAGLSTATRVTQISGRGVGMDVVQSEIKQLGGTISVISEQGKGSTFTLRLPLTVAVTDALVVRSADRFYAIPLVQIERIERVNFDDIKAYHQSNKEFLTIDNTDFRLRYLGTMLNGRPFTEFNQSSGSIPVIVVKSPTGVKQAIQVDELSGSRTEIVVKPLGNQLVKTQGISAATILGDGSVMLILDLLALIRQTPIDFKAITPEVEVAEPVSEKTEIMVIDDSVTVRKVTSRLLERNGFVVHTAKDGIDAIEKLQEITPDLMLLDIEMPRMDGFEVATQVRKTPRIKDVPIIMITSRTGEKHRERAFEIGVNCYMGKPFQENELLENINELVNFVSLDV